MESGKRCCGRSSRGRRRDGSRGGSGEEEMRVVEEFLEGPKGRVER